MKELENVIKDLAVILIMLLLVAAIASLFNTDNPLTGIFGDGDGILPGLGGDDEVNDNGNTDDTGGTGNNNQDPGETPEPPPEDPEDPENPDDPPDEPEDPEDPNPNPDVPGGEGGNEGTEGGESGGGNEGTGGGENGDGNEGTGGDGNGDSNEGEVEGDGNISEEGKIDQDDDSEEEYNDDDTTKTIRIDTDYLNDNKTTSGNKDYTVTLGATDPNDPGTGDESDGTFAIHIESEKYIYNITIAFEITDPEFNNFVVYYYTSDGERVEVAPQYVNGEWYIYIGEYALATEVLDIYITSSDTENANIKVTKLEVVVDANYPEE